MLSFSGSLKVWVCLEPCDLRKGFEGLSGLVAEKLRQVLRSGALFVFCNNRRTRLNVLCFEGSGIGL
jgi:transposase